MVAVGSGCYTIIKQPGGNQPQTTVRPKVVTDYSWEVLLTSTTSLPWTEVGFAADRGHRTGAAEPRTTGLRVDGSGDADQLHAADVDGRQLGCFAAGPGGHRGRDGGRWQAARFRSDRLPELHRHPSSGVDRAVAGCSGANPSTRWPSRHAHGPALRVERSPSGAGSSRRRSGRRSEISIACRSRSKTGTPNVPTPKNSPSISSARREFALTISDFGSRERLTLE